MDNRNGLLQKRLQILKR